jgi:lipopolysaccharide transport system permease protein
LSSARPALSPLAIASSAWRHRELIAQLTRRDIEARYKGSWLGVLWSLILPVGMLAVYTLVLSGFMKFRWPGANGTLEFSLVLFVGLIVFGFFAEVLGRAPGIVVGNPNYVKKVVFPLEVLPWIAVLSALFTALIGWLVWIAFAWALYGQVHWQIVYFPIVLASTIPLALGLGWAVGSLSVFVRDIPPLIGVVTQALLFLSPVFYATESVPKELRLIIQANPLTRVIDQARATMVFGQSPDWAALGVQFTISLLIGYLGFVCFQLTREAFADVL